MKKILSLLTAACLVLSLAACGSSGTEQSSAAQSSASVSEPETAAEEQPEEQEKIHLDEDDLEYLMAQEPEYKLLYYKVETEEELLELFDEETKAAYLACKEKYREIELPSPLYGADRFNNYIDAESCRFVTSYDDVTDEARTLLKSLIEIGLSGDKFALFDAMRADGVLDTLKAVADNERRALFVTYDEEEALIYVEISPFNTEGYYYKLIYRQKSGNGFSFISEAEGTDEVIRYVSAATENYLLQGEFEEYEYYVYGTQQPAICTYKGAVKDEYYDGEIIRYDENGAPERYGYFEGGVRTPHYTDTESQWAKINEGKLAYAYHVSNQGSYYNSYLYPREGETDKERHCPILNGF